jgi:hypothetical protein
MSDTSSTAESAVRTYLLWLAAPESLRDEQRIGELRAAADRATDPIDKLKALSALEDAQAVDGQQLEDDFVARAKEYVAGENIRVDAFRTMGVSDEVLRSAGLLGGPGGPARSTPARRRPGGNRRMPRLNLADVDAAVPTGEFRLAELASAIDREVATTRNYLQRLIGDGKVVEVGEDASGRGKPAKIYRRA